MTNKKTTRQRDSFGKFIPSLFPSTFNKKEYDKKYSQLHREEKIIKAVEWGKNNKDKRKIAKDKWKSKNKEKINFLKRLYYYRKKNAEGRHTLEDVKKLYEQTPLCPYCFTNKPNTIDHIQPLSKGGTNDISNLIPVCVSCNSKKKAKTLIEWQPMTYYMFDQISRANRFNQW